MELTNSWEGLRSCSWLIEKPQLKRLEMISSNERVGQEYCFDCCCLCISEGRANGRENIWRRVVGNGTRD